MSEIFESLFERLPANKGGQGSGKYDAQLDAETRQVLDEFAAWCKDQGMSEASSRSYRSYVAKALALPDEPTTSDQNSAIRKFRKFVEER